MKLEEAIQQKSFKSEYQKLHLNIYYTNNILQGRTQLFFKERDLTPQQFNILRILRGQHPEAVSINTIKERMLDKNSDVSRIVERLRVKKLIERKPCKADRRQMDVRITQAGLDLLAYFDRREDEMAWFKGNLNESEAQTLNELLDKLRGEE